MDELRLVGDKMYHPLNPDHQRRLGQVSFLEEDPEFFADSMEAKDNPPDATSWVILNEPLLTENIKGADFVALINDLEIIRNALRLNID